MFSFYYTFWGFEHRLGNQETQEMSRETWSNVRILGSLRVFREKKRYEKIKNRNQLQSMLSSVIFATLRNWSHTVDWCCANWANHGQLVRGNGKKFILSKIKQCNNLDNDIYMGSLSRSHWNLEMIAFEEGWKHRKNPWGKARTIEPQLVLTTWEIIQL